MKKRKVFTEIARGFPAEIANSSGFSGRKEVISKQKKRSSSTKNTNLDLDLRSRSPEPVNFFGAQSSFLGRAQFSFGGAQAVRWGGTALVCPAWRRVYLSVRPHLAILRNNKIKLLGIVSRRQIELES